MVSINLPHEKGLVDGPPAGLNQLYETENHVSWASDEPSVNPSLGLDDGGGLDDDESLMMILALEHPTLGL